MLKLCDLRGRWLFLVFIVSATIKHHPTPVRSHSVSSRSLRPTTRWGGICGNSAYDIFGTKSVDLVGSTTKEIDSLNNLNRNRKNGKFQDAIPVKFRKFKVPHRKSQRSENALQRLKSEPVVVRLNIVYDKTIVEEFKENKQELEKYVRNLIFSVQLIYEQPEMSSQIKFKFVVVSLKESTMQVGHEVNTVALLDMFAAGPDIEPSEKCDINMYLSFTNLWGGDPNGKLLGIAHTGIFCRSNTNGALVINAGSLGMAITLVHELGHTFNVLHDGDTSSSIEGRCDPSTNIMGPTVSPDAMKWSSCTMEALSSYFSYAPINSCIYDSKRIASATPVNPSFDFTNSENRKRLPGEEMPIDAQCARALDRTTVSAMTLEGKNGDDGYTTCQELVCLLGGLVPVAIGPAPSGSVCDAKKSSKCFNGACGSSLRKRLSSQ